MERKLPIGIAILLFIISGSLFVRRTSRFFVPLSPQATVNPSSITESYSETATYAIVDNEPVIIPTYLASVFSNTPPSTILGAVSEEKRIEVDLTNQRLYAYEGDRKVFDFLISSGLWGKTPVGDFRIWIKLKSTKMEGGSKDLGTYYYLPNVPYTMYFYNNEIPQWRGFGIHGTYWHNNFGKPMSHGCINMRTEEAQALFYWATPDLNGKTSIHASAENPGTKVVIYGTAPGSS